jgi:tRNA(Ile)-lysidine synthetase-like protein
VRHRLVPAAEEVFPGFPKALDALAEKSRLYGDFIKKTLRRENPWTRSADGWECSFEDFLRLHPLLRIESVYGVFNQEIAARGEKRIPYAFLLPLAKLTRKKAEGIILRGKGLVLQRRKDRIMAFRDIVLNRKKGYFYLIDGNLDFCIEERLCVEAEEVSLSASAKDAEDIFSCGEGDCLFLRSRRPGDAILTAGGRKTLNKLFSCWKLGEGLRDMVPLVQKNEKILAVLAAPFGGKTLRLPDDKDGNAGRSFRISIRKIGEESGQTK